MARNSGAGSMREKMHFQVQSAIEPGEPDYGSPQAGPWVTKFTSAAGITPLKGSEPVMAARLTGVQPVIISVWSCIAARAVDAGWRAVDARNPDRVFDITSSANLDQKNAVLEMMATVGVAT